MSKNSEKIVLKPYQEYVVQYMQAPENKGLILYHSTGSGKTITALSAVNQFPEPIVIIGKKSSKKAFKDDMKRLGLTIVDSKNGDDTYRTDQRFTFFTFTKIKDVLNKQFDILAGTSVIVDEAHTLRNETSLNLMIISALSMAKRIVLLTATPVINYLNDLSVLVNIAKDSNVLPTDIESFDAAYYNQQTKTIANPDVLVRKLAGAISYYSIETHTSDYPSTTTEYIEIEMIHEQLMEYKKYIRKYFFDVQLEYRGMGKGEYFVDFGDTHVRKKNFFLSATRQLSNTLDGRSDFPKIKAIHEMIVKQKKEKLTPIIVYSNFLENGVYALTKLLERSSISYKTITGNTSDEKINFIVNDYNKGSIDVLMITSAGSESLDLKNTRIIHIMEPHWNESRIKQVIGRAVRYKSHDALPKSERNVKIYRWASVFPKTIANKSADSYLIELSYNKDTIAKVFDELIQDASIEKRNIKKYDNYSKLKSWRRPSRQRPAKISRIAVDQLGGAVDQLDGSRSYAVLYSENKQKYRALKTI